MQALEAKLAAAEQTAFVRDNTLRLLEEQLKEKEGQVNKLQQDKNKLEVIIGFSWHSRWPLLCVLLSSLTLSFILPPHHLSTSPSRRTV